MMLKVVQKFHPRGARKSAEPDRSKASLSPDADATASVPAHSSALEQSVAVRESLQLEKTAGHSNRVDFFTKGEPFFWLSNNYDQPIYMDGVRYATPEHLFQASKFLEHRPDIAAKVRKAPGPIDAIHEARKHTTEVRSDWILDGVNVHTMRMVLLAKFTQSSELRLALLETGDAELVHACQSDAFWGSAASHGESGRGRNMLGRTLMQTRELLRVAAGVGVGSGTRTV